MFKVGDKVKLNDKGVAMKYLHIKSNQTYEVIGFDSGGYVKFKDVYPTYWATYDVDYFKLVEEKEMKKIKFDINPSIKETKKTFPCIRAGKTTGKLYYFVNSYASGYPLYDDGSATSFENTEPWTGTVTITQD